MTETFDVIVVGAGSAGAAVAARLSEDPRRRVLLLEAGGRDLSPLIHVPAALVRTIGNPAFDWMHLAEPDPSRDGKVDLWPAGKVLGGSSSINGMLWVRGARSDYDRWAASGAAGWAYADVEPYFRRSESTDIGADQARGRSGPMRVERLRTLHPLSPAFIAAAEEAGLAVIDDYNDGDQEGVGYPQISQRRGARWSTARGYLNPARGCPNLAIETNALAQRLVFEGRRCVGVAIDWHGQARTIRAHDGVILAAGALGTPKLLSLSGIGPVADLRALGLEVLVDAPDVGAHLQDHPNANVSVSVSQRTFNQEVNSWRMAWHALNWLVFRKGPATSPYPHAVGFFRTRPDKPEPDVQVMLGPFAFDFDQNGVVPYAGPAVTASVSLSYPRAKGRVSLRASDPRAPLRIEHQLLSDPDDVADLTAACRFVQGVFRAPAFRAHVTEERLPTPAVTSDADWADYLKRATFLGYHPIGTARMGPEGASVVDPRLRVRGVSGLRVADASVIPHHVSGNINATVIMIGERAADLIVEDGGV